ncbi:MAG: Spy/CpxP family protein refolding chaperone [Gammaproteobacteria bacterium]
MKIRLPVRRAALALLIFLAPGAWAMPPFGAQPHGGFGGDLFFIENMAQKLDLDDAQRQRIEALMAEQREQARPYVKTLVETRRDMRRTLKADTFDEAAVRAIAERQAKAMIEMEILRARGRHAMQQVLTPEQRQQMRRHRHGGPDAAGPPDLDDQDD